MSDLHHVASGEADGLVRMGKSKMVSITAKNIHLVMSFLKSGFDKTSGLPQTQYGNNHIQYFARGSNQPTLRIHQYLLPMTWLTNSWYVIVQIIIKVKYVNFAQLLSSLLCKATKGSHTAAISTSSDKLLWDYLEAVKSSECWRI